MSKEAPPQGGAVFTVEAITARGTSRYQIYVASADTASFVEYHSGRQWGGTHVSIVGPSRPVPRCPRLMYRYKVW